MVEHRGLCNMATAQIESFGVEPGDRVLQFASFTFDVSIGEFFSALFSGAALILRSDAWLANAHLFWSLCEAQRVNVLDIPVRFWKLLANDKTAKIPAGVRLLVTGGESVDQAAAADWFNRDGYKPRLFNAYGPTETTVNATFHELLSEEFNLTQAVPIGRPIWNTQIYLLDRYG
ncbi:AMP-binding protein, partial [Dokdonella soli]